MLCFKFHLLSPVFLYLLQLQKEFLRLKPKGEFRNISEKLLEGLIKYGSTVVDKVSKKSRPAILTRILSGLKSQTVKENKRCKCTR